MTEREALIQLATPEPDSPVKTAEWQQWRDRTTEAIRLARALPAARKIFIDPGIIDPENFDVMPDWDRNKSSVTDESGNKIGYIDTNDGKVITIWLDDDFSATESGFANGQADFRFHGCFLRVSVDDGGWIRLNAGADMRPDEARQLIAALQAAIQDAESRARRPS